MTHPSKRPLRRKSSDADTVYFVQAGGPRGPVKIGITNELSKRLESIRVSNAEPIAVLAIMRFGGEPGAARRTEQRLHELFAEFRLEGEWFRWHEDIAVAVAQMRACEQVFGRDINLRMEFDRYVWDGTTAEERERELAEVVAQLNRSVADAIRADNARQRGRMLVRVKNLEEGTEDDVEIEVPT